MNCFLCDQPMVSGHTKWLEYGASKKIAHRACDRDALIGRARQLGVWDDPEAHTDTELMDAIAADRLSGEWLARLDRLPTDEAKREAIHRLRVSFDAVSEKEREQ